jgi:hypothetical protein
VANVGFEGDGNFIAVAAITFLAIFTQPSHSKAQVNKNP